jgi:molybdenum cofactor biosynthesis enzyme
MALAIAVVFTAAAGAQDSGQGPGGPPPEGRGGMMGGPGGMGTMGRGLMGAVTETAADHLTIKTDAGEVYIVHFKADTRFMKQAAGMRGPGGGGTGDGGGAPMGGRGGNPPQTIKVTDIKANDVISIMGDKDTTAKTIQATAVVVVDPERAKMMREMQANFGKTWLAGKITAIDGTKVTLLGLEDNAPHTFVADENTSFRKRRDPITLADLQVGDSVRVDGAVKNGVFTATTVNAMGAMGGPPPNLPRNAPQQ